MSWPILRASLDLLLRSRWRPITVEFSGGEPLLEFRMLRRGVRYVERTRGTRDVRYAVTTNATLLDRERLRFLADHNFEIELSFHAIPTARDPNGRAIFGHLDRVLERLRVEHPRVWRERLLVAVTVGIREIPALADSIDYLVAKGVRHIVMSAAFGQAGWRVGDIAEIRRQFARITALVVSERATTGHVPLVHYRKEQNEPVPTRDPRWCGGGAGHAVSIDPSGQAYACAMLAGARPVAANHKGSTSATRSSTPSSALVVERGSPLWNFWLGDVQDCGFERRLGKLPASVLRTFERRREQRSSYGRCGDCRYIAECSVCPVAYVFDPDSRDPTRVSDFVCAFNRVAFEEREHFPEQPSLRQRLVGHAAVPILVRELRQYASQIRQAAGR